MQVAPVSVIIPCYRCNQTVERAVASVLAQTVLPEELWLVEDASDDRGRTLEILQALQRTNTSSVRIEIIVSAQNIGPGEARNLAWARTAQPYVAFLDADDAWHPRKLEIQYDWMRRHPEVTLSGHLDVVGEQATPRLTPEDVRVTEVTRAALLLSNVLSTRTIMMRASAPFRFPANRRFSDDYYLWLSIVMNGGRAVILQLPLAFQFRPPFSAGGVSDALWRMELGELQNYVSLARAGLVRPWELPVFCAFSIAKFGRRLGINAVRRVRSALGRPADVSPQRDRPRKLLVICPYPRNVAPAQRLKYEQYFDYFESNGISVTVSPFMTRRFWNIVYQKGFTLEKIFWTVTGYLRRLGDIARLPFYDGVYIFLWVTPFGPPIFERIYAWVNRRIVYDIDDMVFLGHTSQANRGFSWLKGKNKMIFLMERARHVIVCTPRLNEFARQYNEAITDISSTINTESYLPLVDHEAKTPLVIGWSGSHSTSKYLRLLEDVLCELRGIYGTHVLVIGDPTFRFESFPSEAVPWRAETEVQDLRRIDIGVYPLPEEEWVYGKSGLKALQYMSLGIPTVATAIGANFRVIEDGVSGFLVRTEEEWMARLRDLIESVELRRRIGAAGRARVEEHYSVHANRDRYYGVVDQILGPLPVAPRAARPGVKPVGAANRL